MYCVKCGTKNSDGAGFCKKCGKIIAPREQTKLRTIYNRVGNISILFGIIGFVVSMAVGFELGHIVTDSIVALLWNFPRVYFGFMLKHKGINDFSYALKISIGMLMYSLIVVVMNLAIDGSGIIYIIPAIFYYFAYKETKIVLRA